MKLHLFFLFSLFIISIKSLNLTLQKQAESGQIQVTKEVALQIYKENFFKQGKETDNKFQIFFKNLQRISQLNQRKDLTWTAGINEFTFMDDAEFNKRLMGPQAGQNCSATASQFQQNTKKKIFKPNEDLPSLFDWRDYGVVSPVKDQQDCGSCWAFSTTAAVESHWSIKTGVAPPQLSEQQLLDCAGDFDNNGCNGGLPSHAFEYLKYAGGQSTEGQYPYTALELFECHYNNVVAGARVKGGSFNITFEDENELQVQLFENGPVSVAYTVDSDFKSYKGGIYNNPDCPSAPEDVNHAVLAVGWGTDGKTNYWILKNSWGPSFGENGYFRMVMGENMCGIADCASYPLLDADTVSNKKHPKYRFD